MDKTIHILIINGSEDDLKLFEHEFKHSKYEPFFYRVETPQALSAALDKQPWDIILANYYLFNFSAPEALKILRKKELDIPFIVISDNPGDEDNIVKLMETGLSDYHFKNNLKRFIPSIEREFSRILVIRQIKKAEFQLERKDAILDKFSSIVKAVINCKDNAELAKSCINLAENFSGSKFSFIAEFDKTNKLNILTVSDSIEQVYKISHSEIIRVVKDIGKKFIFDKIIKEKKSIIINDFTSQFEPLMTSAGYTIINSFIGIPLKEGDKIVGIMGLANKKGGYDLLDQQDIETLAQAFTRAFHCKQTELDLKENLEKSNKNIEETVHALAITVEIRDPYTAGHQRRMAKLARAIANEMKLSDMQIEAIYKAGMLHDIGKISIPSEILSKPGKLTELEFNLIKTHPVVSYDILKGIEFPYSIAEFVLQHHERLNGTGYPKGLHNKEIMLEAKILGVADVVEAMSSHRPYRPSLGINTALDEISKNSNILYDPKVVDVCLKLFKEKKGFKFD